MTLYSRKYKCVRQGKIAVATCPRSSLQVTATVVNQTVMFVVCLSCVPHHQVQCLRLSLHRKNMGLPLSENRWTSQAWLISLQKLDLCPGNFFRYWNQAWASHPITRPPGPHSRRNLACPIRNRARTSREARRGGVGGESSRSALHAFRVPSAPFVPLTNCMFLEAWSQVSAKEGNFSFHR